MGEGLRSHLVDCFANPRREINEESNPEGLPLEDPSETKTRADIVRAGFR
jgi:hypothetical protein